MKVLWICHFSNPQVREKLNLSVSIIEVLTRKLFKKHKKQFHDYATWITNGIEEFEKFDDVELHVVSPHYGMSKKIYSFQINRINYHFFKPDDDSVLKKVKRYFYKNIVCEYKGNRNTIKKIIEDNNPDIIHMYGAENPYYSISALDIDLSKYPIMVSLQTLMSDSEFSKNYPNDNRSYNFRSSIEQKIVKRIGYIGSSVQKYRQVIWSSFNPNAIFFKTYLALEDKVDIIDVDKKYDFVFFAASISKNADIAIEAFALACKQYPNLTLNIIGGTEEPFTSILKLRIKELKIEKNVFFSGLLPEHKDVLKQIQFSKFALLPLKVDIISGTIREAIYCGLPVITNITAGTPLLNEKRKSVLLSEQNDLQGMSNNMIRLIESPDLCKELIKNALITVNERYNNETSMKQLTDVYRAIIDHQINNTPIPSDMGVKL